MLFITLLISFLLDLYGMVKKEPYYKKTQYLYNHFLSTVFYIMYVYKEEYNESVYLYFLTLKKYIIYHVLEDFFY